MEIKVAEYADYSRIAELHAQSWKYFYRGIFAQDYLNRDVFDDRALIWQTRLINPPFNQHVLIAEDKGKLCGFICAFGNHDFERGTIIDALHVDINHRGQGVGKALVTEMLQWIEQFFPDSGVYLEVIAGNDQAVEFYDHLGGQNSEERLWDSPCGRKITELVYTWTSPAAFADKLNNKQTVC